MAYEFPLKLDLRDFAQGITRAGVLMQGFAGRAAGFVNSIRGQLAAASAAATVFAGVSVNAFREDEIAAARLAGVFGEQLTPRLKQFTETLAESSRRGVGDIQALASAAGSVASAVARDTAEFARISESLTEISANAATAFGTDPQQALSAFQAALFGSERAVRQYGIILDGEAVKAQARVLGFDPENLTDQQAALARFQIIMQSSNRVAQQAAAQSDTLNESLRGLGTQSSELAGDVGAVLAPAVRELVDGLSNAVKATRAWIQENGSGLSEQLKGAAKATREYAEAIGGFVAAHPIITGLAAAFAGLGIATVAAGAGLAKIITIWTTLAPIAAAASAWLAGLNVGTLLLAGSLGVLAGSIGVILISLNSIINSYRSARQELQSTAEAEAAAAKAQAESVQNTERLLKTFNDGELARYNDLVRSGESAWKAAHQVARESIADTETAQEESSRRDKSREAERAAAIKRTADEHKAALESLANAERDLSGAVSQRAREQIDATSRIDDNIAAIIAKYDQLRQKLVTGEEIQRSFAAQAVEIEQERLKLRERELSAAEEAASAERALQDIQAQAAGNVEAEIALLRERAELRASEAGSQIEAAQILRKAQAEIDAAVFRDDQKRADEKKRKEEEIANAAESARRGVVEAELRIKEARAAATETLKDDLEVQRQRQALELEAAKSENELAALKKKHLIEQQALIEDNARRQKLADLAAITRAKEFARATQDQVDRRAGRGSEVDVRDTTRRLDDQLKNVVSAKSAEDFNRAARQSFDLTLDDARKRAEEAFNAFQEAQGRLSGPFANTSDRRAAEGDVERLRREAQAAGSQFGAAQDAASTELARLTDAAIRQAEKAEVARQKTENAAESADAGEQATAALGDSIGKLESPIKTLAEGIAALANSDVFNNILGTLQGALDSIANYGAKFDNFGNVMVEKLTAFSSVVSEQGARLDGLSERIAAIPVPQRGNLNATGLGGF